MSSKITWKLVALIWYLISLCVLIVSMFMPCALLDYFVKGVALGLIVYMIISNAGHV